MHVYMFSAFPLVPLHIGHRWLCAFLSELRAFSNLLRWPRAAQFSLSFSSNNAESIYVQAWFLESCSGVLNLPATALYAMFRLWRLLFSPWYWRAVWECTEYV